MANTITITPSAVYRAFSDTDTWRAEDFRVGYYAGAGNWRTKLELPIGDVVISKSIRLAIRCVVGDYTSRPDGVLGVLTTKQLTPAQVLSNDVAGKYRNGAHDDLLADSLALGWPYTSADGATHVAGSMGPGSEFYFVFDVSTLKPNTTYYAYFVRDVTNSGDGGSNRAFTVVPLENISATLTYESYYTVTYDSNEHRFPGMVVSPPSADTVIAGESIYLPRLTTSNYGYKFLGWSTNPNAASGVSGVYTPTESVTLYAIWSTPDSTGSHVYYDDSGVSVKCEVYRNDSGIAIRCDVFFNDSGTAVKT